MNLTYKPTSVILFQLEFSLQEEGLRFRLHQLSEEPRRLVYIVFDKMKTRPDNALLINWPDASPASVFLRSWFTYQPDRTRTVTLFPVLRRPTSPNAWRGRTRYETDLG